MAVYLLSNYFFMPSALNCYCLLLFSRTAGAREAHAVSPHFAQMYCILVCFLLLVMAPLYFGSVQAVTFFRSFLKNKLHSFFQPHFTLCSIFVLSSTCFPTKKKYLHQIHLWLFGLNLCLRMKRLAGKYDTILHGFNLVIKNDVFVHIPYILKHSCSLFDHLTALE